jgi:serine/threonine protein kinase
MTPLRLRVGDWLAGCQIVRSIGRGGMAEVFEVRFGRERQALKVSRPESLRGLGLRMAREAEMLKMVFHPNLVEVFDHGVEPDGTLWIRMALIDGRTLRQLMHDERRRRAPISVPVAVAYLFRAAQGARQCHALGIVHRDIKPENVMVVQEGTKHQVKLLDLGMAKRLDSGQTSDLAPVGTLLYMAPEQFDPRLKVCPATDVYALSLVLYEMLAGHPFVPQDGVVSYPQAAFQHCYAVPPRLETFGIPRPISDVVARGLAKSPEERFAEGGAFAEALWAAWEVVQAADPEVDTNPGEPSIDRILPSGDQAIRFGYAPAGRPKRRRSSLPVPAVQGARVEALPASLQDPDELDAAMERESVLFVAPVADTRRHGEAEAGEAGERNTVEVDPSRLRALVERTREARHTVPMAAPFVLAAGGRPAPRPFVPVQHTEPLPRGPASQPSQRSPASPPHPPLVRVQPTEPLPRPARERHTALPAAPRVSPSLPFETPLPPPTAATARGSGPAARRIERVFMGLFALVALTVWVVAGAKWSRDSAPPAPPNAAASVPAASPSAPAPADTREASPPAPSASSQASAVLPAASAPPATSTPALPTAAPLLAPKPTAGPSRPSELVDPWAP